MRKHWTAALLAAVMLAVVVTSGAAVPVWDTTPGAPQPAELTGLTADAAADSAAQISAGRPAADVTGADDSAAGGSTAAAADTENAAYVFTPARTVYSMLAVSPAGVQSPFTPPTFSSGTVKNGSANVPQDQLRFEWYAATRLGDIENQMPLGTEATFSASADPNYSLNRVGTHFYLERIYVGDQEVGSQLFCAAVMTTGMDLTVSASQNDQPVSSATVTDGAVTMVANFDYTYFEDMRNYIYRNMVESVIPLTTHPSMSIGSVRASWHPQDVQSGGIQFSNGSGFMLPTPNKPTLVVTSFSSPSGYTDFYFSMRFPFTATTKLLTGGTQTSAGELCTLTRTVRIYSGEAVTEPTPTTDPDPGESQWPADWQLDLFANAPLTQQESEDLYKELIAPYVDRNNWRTPFTLAAPQMENGYLVESSQKGLLGLINFIRRSAGVNMVQTIDPQFNVYCQAGTNYMSRNDVFGHHVADNSGDRNAIRGLQDSNLAWGSYNTGRPYPIQDLQLGQFYDDDINNLPDVGHRRWLLDSRLTKTGFGYTGPTSANNKTYQATFVLDPVFGYTIAESLEAFPGIGAYPIELMDFRAWSIGIGALGGRDANWTVNADEITMTITRERDQKTWTLQPNTTNTYLSNNTDWFSVRPADRGHGAMILFRPASIFPSGNFTNTQELIGETFTIRIEGIKDEGGVPTTICYGTQFYSLEGSPVLEPAPLPPSGPDASAAESVVWWTEGSTVPPALSVSVPQSPACTYSWYSLLGTEQDVTSGVALSETGAVLRPDTSSWVGGSTHYFACVVRYADQLANGTGESIVHFTVHVEDLGDAVDSAVGVDSITEIPAPPGVDADAVYYVTFSPAIFEENAQPTITAAGAGTGSTWTISTVGPDKQLISVGTSRGPTVEVPKQAGLYALEIEIAPGGRKVLFVGPVEGSVEAEPSGSASYNESLGAYVLPAGQTDTTITVSWDHRGNVQGPASGCVEYVWELLTAARPRTAGLTLKPNGNAKPLGDGKWITSGSGSDTAVLSGLSDGIEAEVIVTPYAPGTYGTAEPIALGNSSTTRVVTETEPAPSASAEPSASASTEPSASASTAPSASASAEPSASASAVPSASGSTGPAASASTAPSYPVNPPPSASATGIPGASLNPAPTNHPTAQPSSGGPAASPTGRPTLPTYIPTYNPDASWTTLPTASAAASPSASAAVSPSASVSAPASVAPSASVSASTAPVPSLPAAEPSIGPKPEAPFTVATEPNPDGGGELLTGVPVSSRARIVTAEDLLAAVEVPDGCTVTVETAAGEPLAADQPVGTGCIVTVSSSAATARYTLVVEGDVLGTGYMTPAQLVRLAQALNGSRPLEGIYLLAAKLAPVPGPVNIMDLVAMARILTEPSGR